MIDAPVVIFDGVCKFCNSSVIFLIKRDKKEKLLFAPLQSESGKRILIRYNIAADISNPESVIFINNDKVYQKSDAVIEVLRYMGGIYKLASLFKIIPKFVRDPVYMFIAKNRYRIFGKKPHCIVPGPEIKSRFLG